MKMEKRTPIKRSHIFPPGIILGTWLMLLALLAGRDVNAAEFNGVVKLPDGINLQMVKINAGSFEMGIPENTLGHDDKDDKRLPDKGKDFKFLPAKLHRVTLTKDYWLGEYEVTQAQWASVMRACNPHFALGLPADNFLAKYKEVVIETAKAEGSTENILKNVTLKKYIMVDEKNKEKWDWRPNVAKNIYDHLFGSYYKTCPMESVSWHDAKEFCKRLNELYRGRLPQGYHFDLPTEAQWEYACRAGTKTALNTGQELTAETGACYNLHEAGWYHENSDDHIDALPIAPKENDRKVWGLWPFMAKQTPHKAGGKRPNGWGLYDMHGNVCEWCRDSGEADYASDPEFLKGNDKGINNLRVFRGGSYLSNPRETISGYRKAAAPNLRDATIGFRLALVPDLPPTKAATKEVRDGRIEINLSSKEKMTFEKIKAGKFWMGSPRKEWGRSPFEIMHEVALTNDYWLGTYEVTQGQWKAVMSGSNPAHFKTEGENNEIKKNLCPVENVSWYMAKAFCERLNDRYGGELPRGYHFDLPTEAQWEYACRAGTATALNSGTDLTKAKFCFNLDTVGWFAENSGRPKMPQAVGGKLPNKWGLYDMHGNVGEWCLDVYGDYKKDDDGNGAEVTNPLGGEDTDTVEYSRLLKAGEKLQRVYRGGGCQDNSRSCRSAFRGSANPNHRSESIGFRIAIVPDDK